MSSSKSVLGNVDKTTQNERLLCPRGSKALKIPPTDILRMNPIQSRQRKQREGKQSLSSNK